MTESKIAIKAGRIEFQATGDSNWVSDQLDKFWDKFEKIKAAASEDEGEEADPIVRKRTREGNKSLTTSVIATKLSCDSGPGLILAASANLGLVKGKVQFTRTEITDEMKTATAFFSKNYISNLSKYLKKLVVGNQLNEVGAQTYALSSTEREKLKTSLGL